MGTLISEGLYHYLRHSDRDLREGQRVWYYVDVSMLASHKFDHVSNPIQGYIVSVIALMPDQIRMYKYLRSVVCIE